MLWNHIIENENILIDFYLFLLLGRIYLTSSSESSSASATSQCSNFISMRRVWLVSKLIDLMIKMDERGHILNLFTCNQLMCPPESENRGAGSQLWCLLCFQLSCYSEACLCLLQGAALTLCTSPSLCLCSFLRVAVCCVQIEPRGSAVAWWFPATKACPASLTCPSKPKTCGRSHGSRCSWSSVSGMGSLGRFGWVRIESPPSKGATRKEPHRTDGDTRHNPKHRPIIWLGSIKWEHGAKMLVILRLRVLPFKLSLFSKLFCQNNLEKSSSVSGNSHSLKVASFHVYLTACSFPLTLFALPPTHRRECRWFVL